MENKSYQQIRDKFDEFFPELKRSVKDWSNCVFNKDLRIVEIELKNGCYIYFGTYKNEDNEWTWVANLDMSDKTKERLGITEEE